MDSWFPTRANQISAHFQPLRAIAYFSWAPVGNPCHSLRGTSSDGGATWSEVGLRLGVNVLAIDPLHPNVVYAATATDDYSKHVRLSDWGSLSPEHVRRRIWQEPEMRRAFEAADDDLHDRARPSKYSVITALAL